MRCYFTSISELFEQLNAGGINYLVLRNYENLLEPEMYLDGHGDVDLLCDDALSVVKLIDAQAAGPRAKSSWGDGIHYCAYVAGQRVTLDLRQVGDGYYCKKWEQELLERKVRHECFYVMSDEDYFYTLIYHAILQKRTFSDEYRLRLEGMSRRLGLEQKDYSQLGFISILEKHMMENGYVYTYSHDHMVPNRFSLVDRSLVQGDRGLWWKHFRFEANVAVIEWLVRIKHALNGLF